MPADTIEQIKSRLDVVDVISGYLKVQRAGVNFKARCPFHNEKTPSFYISPERQIWHCFGCAKGGDMFGFVKDIEGVEFPEALRILAQKAGVQIERTAPGERNEKNQLYEICEHASKFFEKQLWESPTGQKALAYLKERGLEDATIKEFRLGYAPDDWHALEQFLTRTYTRKTVARAGLAVEKDGRQYDRFRSRITFPIADINGQIVGFTGRVFSLTPVSKEEEGAKYINTPQTLIYDKSRVLYGLHHAKVDIKSADHCVLVEGNMDAIMSYQAGVKNVVATSGTALTSQHLRLLQRYTTNLNFCFDTDQAGALATRRGIGLAIQQNFQIKVVSIGDTECKDPADYVKKYGAKWSEVVAGAKPVIEFYFDTARKSYDPNSAESKRSIVSVVAPLLQRLTSRVERSHWIAHMAGYLRVREDDLEKDVLAAKDDLEGYERTEAPVTIVVAKSEPVTLDMLSGALLSVLMKNPGLFRTDIGTIDMRYLDPQITSIMQRLTAQQEGFNIDAFMKETGETGYRLEFAYLKSQELWKDFSDEELKAEFYTLLHKIKQKGIVAQLTKLEFDIKQSEAQRDSARTQALANQFMELTQQLAEVQKV
jgi:DNA primase